MRLIFNVPYCPQFMGVEKVWAILKKKTRAELVEPGWAERGESIISLV